MFAELQKQELTLSLLTNGIKTQNKFYTIKTELNLVPENKIKHRSIYTGFTASLFTKELITFRRSFQITIRLLIGFMIWTTCVHKHCNSRPEHKRDLHTELIFCCTIASGLQADFAFLSSLLVHTAYARITFRKSFAFTSPQNQDF